MRNLAFFVAFLLVPMSFALADVPQGELNALNALYNATNDPPLPGDPLPPGWEYKAGWEGGVVPVCTPVTNPPTPLFWTGVVCDPTMSTVISITLNENHLVGHIPAELWVLENLEYLYLSANQLSGIIPRPDPGQLQKLRSLWLYNNQLTGIIPPELGGLPEMRRLRLETNNLSGHIPEELANLSELEWLNLFDNQLTGPIPPLLGNLENLVKLQLHNNQLSGNIPITFDDTMSSLQWLFLNNNRLRGPIPPCLAPCLPMPSLRKLRLSENQLSGSIPSSLGDLSTLNELDLHNNQLSGEIPWQLGNLHRFGMKWIYLQNNYLTGDIPFQLGNLEFMLWLDLSNNRLSGPIPPQLSNIKALTKLFLNSNQLTGDIPQELEARRNTFEKNLGLDIRWNALHTHDEPFMEDFLNEYQVGLDAISSQTIPPENDGVPPPNLPDPPLTVEWVGDQSVGLVWDEPATQSINYPPPPPFPGGYEVFYSSSGPDGPFYPGGRISGWEGDSRHEVHMPVTGLAGATPTSYWFKVGTYTNPHPENPKNTVSSDLEVAVVSDPEVITGTGCTAPVISIVWNGPVATLSVPDIYDSYEWGSVTPPSGLGSDYTIDVVNPGAPQDFWVTVEFEIVNPDPPPADLPCKEAALIHVDPGLFADGFESGDTSLWSTSVP